MFMIAGMTEQHI